MVSCNPLRKLSANSFQNVLRGKSLIWLMFPRAGWVSARIKTTTIEQNSAATATLFDSLRFRVLSLKMQR
jgi:hypothetical protein